MADSTMTVGVELTDEAKALAKKIPPWWWPSLRTVVLFMFAAVTGALAIINALAGTDASQWTLSLFVAAGFPMLQASFQEGRERGGEE